jgi:hypothetical protein
MSIDGVHGIPDPSVLRNGVILCQVISYILKHKVNLPWKRTLTFSRGWKMQLAMFAAMPATEFFQG